MTPNGKGFEITVDAGRHLLLIRVWGAWGSEFAKKYDSAMREQIEKISANGKAWSALVDVTEFRPQSEEVTCIMNKYIPFAKEQGMKKIGYLGNGQFTQVALESLFPEQEKPAYSFFESEDDAIRWLMNEQLAPRPPCGQARYLEQHEHETDDLDDGFERYYKKRKNGKTSTYC